MDSVREAALDVDDSAARDFELLMVTYHSRKHVDGFLQGLPVGIPIAFVDNAQGADELESEVSHRPGTRYQHGPARGFATGANIAARSSTADYLVFVNPDSRPSMQTIDALLAELRADPDLGAVAATMVGPDGRTERGVGGWEVSVRRAIVHSVGAHKIFRKHGLFARPEPGEPYDVDWVTGACMAVPRRVFEEVGGFDERYFVYSEDVDFGHRLRSAGYRLRLRTDLLVPHSAGSSGGSSLGMQRLKGASFAAYTRRRLGATRAAGVLFVMTVGFLARALASRLRGRKDQSQSELAYIRGMVFGSGPLPGAAKTE